MKAIAFLAIACTAFAQHLTLTIPQPKGILVPFGAWVPCAYITPIPDWAEPLCAALPANEPQPWALYVTSISEDATAFAYSIEFTDLSGKPSVVSGAFLRSGGGMQTLWPVPGIDGPVTVQSVRVQELEPVH